jgi:hypothetical protein
MAKQFLNGADVAAHLQEVGRKRMAKGMAGNPLRKTSSKYCVPDRPLYYGLMKMVAAKLSTLGLDVRTSCGKHPLPGPLAAGARELASKRFRQLDPSATTCEIALMLFLHSFQLSGKIGLHHQRQHSDAVFPPLSLPHHNLVPSDVDVLHT